MRRIIKKIEEHPLFEKIEKHPVYVNLISNIILKLGAAIIGIIVIAIMFISPNKAYHSDNKFHEAAKAIGLQDSNIYSQDLNKFLGFQINCVYRSNNTGDLKQINNGTILHSGDLYKLIITPDQDCYVYIYQVDSSGQIDQLFPMRDFKGVRISNENPVVQGKIYYLPAIDKSFKLDQKVGREKIYFITSKKSNSNLEALSIDLQLAMQQQNLEKAKKVNMQLTKNFNEKGLKTRGLEGIVTDKSIKVPWENAANIFSVLTKRLDKVVEKSIYAIEFYHE